MYKSKIFIVNETAGLQVQCHSKSNHWEIAMTTETVCCNTQSSVSIKQLYKTLPGDDPPQSAPIIG